MAFVVINSIRASETQLPGVIAEVMSFGLDSVRDQPGFRALRLMAAAIGWPLSNQDIVRALSPEGG